MAFSDALVTVAMPCSKRLEDLQHVGLDQTRRRKVNDGVSIGMCLRGASVLLQVEGIDIRLIRSLATAEPQEARDIFDWRAPKWTIRSNSPSRESK